jgi:hypothetical protein
MRAPASRGHFERSWGGPAPPGCSRRPAPDLSAARRTQGRCRTSAAPDLLATQPEQRQGEAPGEPVVLSAPRTLSQWSDVVERPVKLRRPGPSAPLLALIADPILGSLLSREHLGRLRCLAAGRDRPLERPTTTTTLRGVFERPTDPAGPWVRDVRPWAGPRIDRLWIAQLGESSCQTPTFAHSSRHPWLLPRKGNAAQPTATGRHQHRFARPRPRP